MVTQNKSQRWHHSKRQAKHPQRAGWMRRCTRANPVSSCFPPSDPARLLQQPGRGCSEMRWVTPGFLRAGKQFPPGPPASPQLQPHRHAGAVLPRLVTKKKPEPQRFYFLHNAMQDHARGEGLQLHSHLAKWGPRAPKLMFFREELRWDFFQADGSSSRFRDRDPRQMAKLMVIHPSWSQHSGLNRKV